MYVVYIIIQHCIYVCDFHVMHLIIMYKFICLGVFNDVCFNFSMDQYLLCHVFHESWIPSYSQLFWCNNQPGLCRKVQRVPIPIPRNRTWRWHGNPVTFEHSKWGFFSKPLGHWVVPTAICPTKRCRLFTKENPSWSSKSSKILWCPLGCPGWTNSLSHGLRMMELKSGDFFIFLWHFLEGRDKSSLRDSTC